MLHIIVLGSAAGGGFPQWNCNTPASQRARNRDPAAQQRTQASIAVSADTKRWFLLNASPDLRAQILATPELYPQEGLRSTPIAGVILTGGEIDVITGLLTMRERQAYSLLATHEVLSLIKENPIFSALEEDVVKRMPLALDKRIDLPLITGENSGLTLIPFAVPGKAPLYAENKLDPAAIVENGESIGLHISDGKHNLFYIPGCARMTQDLAHRLKGADCVFFDGTLWSDDEMVKAGLSEKTGKRMGHMSLSEADGTLKAFKDLNISKKILIHINNSNPILLEDSAEHLQVKQAGWDIAFDGMKIEYD